jgi:hypothetical protein
VSTTSTTEHLHDSSVEVEAVPTRWAARRMVAARRGNLEERLLMTRARVTAETRRRSEESQESDPLRN